MMIVQINRISGFVLNPNDKVVNSIFRRLEKTEGVCPCLHEEWTGDTPKEDKLCPCVSYRNGEGCKCGLYLKLVNN